MKETAVTVLKFAVSFGILFFIARKVGARNLWKPCGKRDLSFYTRGHSHLPVRAGIKRLSLVSVAENLSICRCHFTRILSMYFLGQYFNLFLPTAIGGDAVRIYYLDREMKSLSGCGMSVFLDRDLGMCALLIIATVVAAIAGTSINGVALAPIFGIIVLAFAVADLAIFYRPTYNLLHKILSLTKMKSVDENVEKLFKSVNAYRGQYGIIGSAVLLSLIIQIGSLPTFWWRKPSVWKPPTVGWIFWSLSPPSASST